MTDTELVQSFRQACLEQYKTQLYYETDASNLIFETLVALRAEFRARGSQTRRRLLELLRDDNRQVRLQAAKAVYPAAREEAKTCLQDLAAARFPDEQSLSAAMCLDRLERVPDCLDP